MIEGVFEMNKPPKFKACRKISDDSVLINTIDAANRGINILIRKHAFKGRGFYRPRMHSQGWIYVLKVGEFTKIGTSESPVLRIKTWKSSIPFPIDVVGIYCAYESYQIENKLHKHFKSKRVTVEWFSLNKPDEDFIKEYFSKATVIIRKAKNGSYFRHKGTPNQANILFNKSGKITV